MGDIIKFPKNNPRAPRSESIEQIDERISNVSMYHINETLESIIPLLFSRLAMAGFDLAANDDIKNGALLVEALRSVLCQFHGIEHPFQEVAENIFNADNEGVLSLAKNLHIEFKQDITTKV